MNTKASIHKIFKQNDGFARSKDITDAGIHHSYLKKMLDDGEIEKVKRGLYKLSAIHHDDEMQLIAKMIPDGVFCMYSAWSYYELINLVSTKHHVSILKSKKLKLPAYPPIKLYYWSEKYVNTGIIKTKLGSGLIRIYDLEKSVCDAIKFRNKIGKDTVNEILKTYLARKDRNIELLLRYARQLRVEKAIKQYLEILV